MTRGVEALRLVRAGLACRGPAGRGEPPTVVSLAACGGAAALQAGVKAGQGSVGGDLGCGRQ